MSATIPVAVIVTTRNEEANLERCLRSVHGLVEQVFVIDSESSDRTIEIAKRYADEVAQLAYDHSRIIPWIFQWGLDNLPIRSEWVLILEADQALTEGLRDELVRLFLASGIAQDGFYIRRQQIFRGKRIRFGGYGRKYMLKLFRRGKGHLDPMEQDTRVYVSGPVGKLRHGIEEWNRKEDEILFYLQKHLRYADAFAREELERRRTGASFKGSARLLGAPDERVLWMKQLYYGTPLYLRPLGYFVYRYFFRLGFLDGATGFLFHFLQAFWFRLITDVRLSELSRPIGRAGEMRE